MCIVSSFYARVNKKKKKVPIAWACIWWFCLERHYNNDEKTRVCIRSVGYFANTAIEYVYTSQRQMWRWLSRFRRKCTRVWSFFSFDYSSFYLFFFFSSFFFLLCKSQRDPETRVQCFSNDDKKRDRESGWISGAVDEWRGNTPFFFASFFVTRQFFFLCSSILACLSV